VRVRVNIWSAPTRCSGASPQKTPSFPVPKMVKVPRVWVTTSRRSVMRPRQCSPRRCQHLVVGDHRHPLARLCRHRPSRQDLRRRQGPSARIDAGSRRMPGSTSNQSTRCSMCTGAGCSRSGRHGDRRKDSRTSATRASTHTPPRPSPSLIRSLPRARQSPSLVAHFTQNDAVVCALGAYSCEHLRHRRGLVPTRLQLLLPLTPQEPVFEGGRPSQ
jgi:hypothetical protein